MNFSRSEVVLFSVIIPAHNRAEYLGDAVLSVCEQTIPPEEYEVIVVDNGSTDETRKVVESIASEHSIVRYIYESRIGLHNARHAGARESTGEILVYIDEDVIVPPGWLQAMAGWTSLAGMGVSISACWIWVMMPWNWLGRKLSTDATCQCEKGYFTRSVDSIPTPSVTVT
jgi:glycosyltransferase involved in cell wall biosynthesis